ncbi:hypothetical protein [Larkinella harenae]
MATASSSGSNTNRNTTEEEKHYKSLIELFKWILGCVTGFVAILTGLGSWFFFSNGQEMRAALQAERQEMKSAIKEMKDDVKDQQKELMAKEAAMDQRVSIMQDKVMREIGGAKTDALVAVENVKREAGAAARNEAANRVSQVFRERNIESFIEAVAKEKLTPEITKIVDGQLANVRSYADDLGLLNKAAINPFPLSYQWLDSLQRFSQHSRIREQAKSSIDKITRELRASAANILITYKALDISKQIDQFRESYGSALNTENEPKFLSIVHDRIVAPSIENINIEDQVLAWTLFNSLTGKNIDLYDYKSLEAAYNEYKRRPYKLKLQ